MRKKVIAFASVVVAVAATVTVMTAFAFNPTPAAQADIPEQAAPVAAAAPAEQPLPVTPTAYAAPSDAPCLDGNFDLFALMFDEDGQPVSKDILEANLDKAVEDGYLDTEDKAFLIEMFDYCIAGGGSAGMPCGPGMGGAGFSGCPFSK